MLNPIQQTNMHKKEALIKAETKESKSLEITPMPLAFSWRTSLHPGLSLVVIIGLPHAKDSSKTLEIPSR